MPATAAAALDAPAAARLVAAAAGGGTELLGALAGAPVLTVGLDGVDDLAAPVPPWLPCVVVGVTSGPATWAAPAGVDVALTAGGPAGAPAGWVATEDVDAALAGLCERVERSPEVAVVFAHVLRVSEHLATRDALVLESLTYSALQGGPAFATWLAGRRSRPVKHRPDTDRTVLVERRGDELVLTLNRPHVRNAVNARLRDELCAALAVASADPSVSSIELRGAGPAFSSGGDLDEFGSLPDTSVAHLVRTSRSPARLLAGVAERTTAFVHGACVGAGIELSAFARRVVAAPDARVRLPEVGLGLVPGAGGTVSIPHRIGRQRTAWLGLSAATVDAGTAHQWGLVDEVASPG
jgi:enoyl-CoA hydratase/carnithine racemase